MFSSLLSETGIVLGDIRHPTSACEKQGQSIFRREGSGGKNVEPFPACLFCFCKLPPLSSYFSPFDMVASSGLGGRFVRWIMGKPWFEKWNNPSTGHSATKSTSKAATFSRGSDLCNYNSGRYPDAIWMLVIFPFDQKAPPCLQVGGKAIRGELQSKSTK